MLKLPTLIWILYLAGSCFANEKTNHFWVQKNTLGKFIYNNIKIGESIKTFNQQAEEEVKGVLQQLDDTTNVAKVSVFWCSKTKCNQRHYPYFYISKWVHGNQQENGNLISVGSAYNNFYQGLNTDNPADMEKVEKDFIKFRNLENSKAEKKNYKLSSFAQPYCHSEQAFLSHLQLNPQDMQADKTATPDMIIINIVSSNPACSTCLKTLNKFRLNDDQSKKLIKILFPKSNKENVKLHFLYHFTEQTLGALTENNLKNLNSNHFLETGNRPGD